MALPLRLTTAIGTILILSACVATEFYQEWMPIGRTADMFDSVANVAGTLLGYFTWWFWRPADHQES